MSQMRHKILKLINQRRFFTDEKILALGTKAVPELITLFDEITDDEEGMYHQAVIHMLGLLNGDQSVEFLKLLYHRVDGKDETLQMATLSALARTDHKDALALILPLLITGQKRARKNAIVGLRGSKRTEVLSKIRKCAQSDPDPSIRLYSERVAAEIEERLREE